METTGTEVGDAPTACTLRPVSRKDLDRVLEIEAASFSSPWPRQAFELAIRAPRILFLASTVSGDEIRGYVVAVRDAEGVLIANLAVAPVSRRQGTGRALLDAAVDWGRDLGAPVCHLEVRASNRPAIAMYRQAGFRAVGIQHDYYRQPVENALSMEYRPRRP